MSSLFGGLFGGGSGPSKFQKDAWNSLSGLGDYSSSAGKQYIGQGAGFYSDILSGDPSKIATAIAPEADIIRGQAQQRKNQLAQFSNRSGGTGGAAQMIDTESQGAIDKLINSLIPQAANNLTGVGTSLIGQAGSNYGTVGGQATQQNIIDQYLQSQAGAGLMNMLTGGLGNLSGDSNFFENLGNFGKGALGIGG